MKDYIESHGIKGKYITFPESTHTVAQAARAARADPGDFVKNVCLMGKTGLIVAIVKGEDRVGLNRVGEILGIPRPRRATPEEVLELTGYPVGGVPSFGFEAIFLMDEEVLKKEMVYTGGGDDRSLLKMAPEEILKASGALVVRIRE
jgi:prolyl-tRNA editing enzyme YbaK/EbsC (Cys-tRNA(Pro) deacylase)